MTLRLSHTQIDMLGTCGYRWKFRYVDKIRRAPGTALLRGRAVGMSVQRNMEAKRDTGKTLELEEIRTIAAEALVSDWEGGVKLDDDEIKAGERKAKGVVTDTVVRMATTHALRLAPKLFPVGVEERFEIELEGYDCSILGYLDIREANGFIRDTKTKGKKPTQDEADSSSQLTLYDLANRVTNGTAAPAVVLDCLVNYATKPDEVFSLYSRREDAQIQTMLRRIESAVGAIEAGVFTPADPTSWQCSKKWCDYWEDCPYAMRPVSVAVEDHLVSMGRSGQK